MKLKLIALAAAALVSGAANAAIDPGLTGNGNLMFTIWDSSSSYTLNTGYTIDSFTTASAAPGFSYSFTDSLLTSWLSTAAADAAWTIFAGDSVGATRAITTTDGSNAGVTLSNQNAKAISVNNGSFIDANLNLNGGPFGTAGVIDNVASSTSAAYTGASSLAFAQAGYVSNFNSNGSLANNSAANGLSVIRIDGKNALASQFSIYNSTGTTAWVGTDNAFHIGTVAAVPEPESLAMLLAGIGLVGSIARRRNRKAA